MTTDDIAQRLAELERQVTAQQETIERQQARIEQQAETIKRHQSRIEQQAELLEHQDSPVPSPDPGAQTAANGPERNGDRASTLVSRRSLLSAAAAVGVGSFATGAASATEPRGVVGTDQHPVRTLYLQTLAGPLTDGTAVTTLAGDGLTLDGGALETDLTTAGAGTPVGTRNDDGATQLRGLAEGDNVTITEDAGTITVGASDTRADVSEDGTTVASSVEDINFDGRSVSVTRSGDGVAVEVDDENTDTQTDVSDSGSTVVFSTSDIDFGANLSASSDGVGGATVDADVQGATNWEEADSDDLLETVSPYTGIDVTDIQTDSLNGGVTGNTDLTSLTGNGLAISGNSLGIASGSVDSAELASDSVTIDTGTGLQNGGSIALGSSRTIDIDTSDIAGSNLVSEGGGSSLGLDSNISTTNLTLKGDPEGTSRIELKDFPVSDGNVDIFARNTITLDASGATSVTVDVEGEIETSGEITTSDSVTFGGDVLPKSSGNYDLGGGNASTWKKVYATDGVDTSSDARLKQNITDLSDGLDRLRDIRPVSYQWKDREDPDTRLGFIAQELDDAVPEAVNRPDDEDAPLGVTYDMVLPVAVGAIQTQQDRIEDLEAENAALRDRLDRIEGELDIDTTASKQGVADD